MINYRIRSIRMLFVILMTLAAGAQMAHAAKGGRSDFYQKYMSRPSEELIRIGKDYRLRKNKPDSALLFFTIVAGRYTPNMSAEEKREVVEALNMNYFIYSFTYLNYPKAYEKVIELNQEMDGMKERQTQHRIWLIVAVLTTLFFVIILLVVMRENRELRRRNLALYHRSLEVLKSDEMAGKQRKTVSAPAVEENNAATASSKHHHSTLSDADKDRIAQLVQQVMEQTEVIIQPDFTVEKLAQNISTGQKYVSQVINETFECNFNTLLGRYRIREACRRFNDPQRYGSYTIESIARDLGFKSRSNFATTFKKHTGLNPSEYLRLAKEKNGL